MTAATWFPQGLGCSKTSCSQTPPRRRTQHPWRRFRPHHRRTCQPSPQPPHRRLRPGMFFCPYCHRRKRRAPSRGPRPQAKGCDGKRLHSSYCPFDPTVAATWPYGLHGQRAAAERTNPSIGLSAILSRFRAAQSTNATRTDSRVMFSFGHTTFLIFSAFTAS